MFELTQQETKLFQKLSTPEKIQDFLDTLPFNFEKRGETHMSPRWALGAKKAHCIEGALIAAAALWVHGEQPLLLDLIAKRPDDDHVVALYKKNGYWGAISKTNHACLRFRDPLYKNVRELALSYFHEWFMNDTGEKTLRSYSTPLNLKKFGGDWITSEKELWWLDKELNTLPHHTLIPKGNERFVRKADSIEIRAGKIVEWNKTNKGT